jgi:hypothetical protein
VSLGCVVVPVTFYADVVQPLLGRSRAVIYVLPEQILLSQLLQPVFRAGFVLQQYMVRADASNSQRL